MQSICIEKRREPLCKTCEAINTWRVVELFLIEVVYIRTCIQDSIRLRLSSCVAVALTTDCEVNKRSETKETQKGQFCCKL